MKTRIARFNAFLLAALAVLSGLMVSCSSPGEGKGLASIQFHLEMNPDGTDKIGPVTIGRSVPFQVTVDKVSFLSERQLLEAQIVEHEGTFAIKLKFDQKGTWLLEQYTTAHRGKRAAIMARWEGQGRWIGAPRMEQRQADGTFEFTPDASREETEKFVEGLNKSAKAIQSGRF